MRGACGFKVGVEDRASKEKSFRIRWFGCYGVVKN